MSKKVKAILIAIGILGIIVIGSTSSTSDNAVVKDAPKTDVELDVDKEEVTTPPVKEEAPVAKEESKDTPKEEAPAEEKAEDKKEDAKGTIMTDEDVIASIDSIVKQNFGDMYVGYEMQGNVMVTKFVGEGLAADALMSKTKGDYSSWRKLEKEMINFSSSCVDVIKTSGNDLHFSVWILNDVDNNNVLLSTFDKQLLNNSVTGEGIATE